ETDGSHLEDIPGIYGDHGDGASKEDGKKIEGQRAQDLTGMQYETQPFLDAFPGFGIADDHHLFWRKRKEQDPGDEDIGADDAEADEIAGMRDKEAGRGMSEHRS